MKVHFIAIGGSAMHNLAIALHNKGYQVTGSDDEIFEPSKSRLASRGILPIDFGWFPEKLTSELDAVVLGMHAKSDNPELLKAQSLGLKIYSYPEFLYEQSKNKTRVVIGGSHGKTTITSMILHVMHYHDREVDYMVGAQLEGFDVMVKLTEENDFIVLEGDEYLSSPIDRRPKFHLYKPNIALISGIAWDHINVFPTYENYVEQFSIFVDSIVRGGSINYNEEDAEVKRVVEASENQIRKIHTHDLVMLYSSASPYTVIPALCFFLITIVKEVAHVLSLSDNLIYFLLAMIQHSQSTQKHNHKSEFSYLLICISSDLFHHHQMPNCRKYLSTIPLP